VAKPLQGEVKQAFKLPDGEIFKRERRRYTCERNIIKIAVTLLYLSRTCSPCLLDAFRRTEVPLLTIRGWKMRDVHSKLFKSTSMNWCWNFVCITFCYLYFALNLC